MANLIFFVILQRIFRGKFTRLALIGPIFLIRWGGGLGPSALWLRGYATGQRIGFLRSLRLLLLFSFRSILLGRIRVLRRVLYEDLA